MGWIQTEVWFPRRGRMFTVSGRDAVNHGFHHNALRNLATMKSPDDMELFLRAFVVEARPELADCELLYMNFDVMRDRWEIGVSHPSLPVVSAGGRMGDEPLFKEVPPCHAT